MLVRMRDLLRIYAIQQRETIKGIIRALNGSSELYYTH